MHVQQNLARLKIECELHNGDVTSALSTRFRPLSRVHRPPPISMMAVIDPLCYIGHWPCYVIHCYLVMENFDKNIRLKIIAYQLSRRCHVNLTIKCGCFYTKLSF